MEWTAMGSSCFVHYPSLSLSPSSSWPHLLCFINPGPNRKGVLKFLSVSALPFRKWNYGDSAALASAGAAHKCTATMLMVRRRQLWVHSVDKDSQPQYELDQEKALQALNELDQQLDSLLKKPAPQPKTRASNLPDTLRDQMKGEEPVFTGPSLAYGAFALFVFTVLYNIIFLTVIKPSIDIP